MVNSKSCTSLKWRFERLANVFQFGKGLRHLLLELRHRFGRAHAGHDVFALGVDQKFAVEHFFAGRRIARERHAGSGVLAGVAVNHRLHVDRGSPFGRDVVFAAIDNRAVVHPGTEHGADRAPELLPRILRKFLAGAFLDQRLETLDQFLADHPRVSLVSSMSA